VEEDQAPVSLTKLYGVYKQTAAATSSKSKDVAEAAGGIGKAPSVVVDKEKAEKLKSDGNKLLAVKDFNKVYLPGLDKYAKNST
jgi:hypothetical protein